MSRALEGVRFWAFAASLLCWAVSPPVRAQSAHSEDSVKAAYIYRFTGYVDWPEDAGAGHPFVIDVYEDPGLAAALKRLLPGHPINNQPAEVREVSRIQDLGNAQILYIGPGHADFLRAVAAHQSRSMLIVSDDQQGLDLGSVFNFVTVDNRVRFEVSLTAADRAGVKISSELLSVAVRVHGGRRQSDYFSIPLEYSIRQASLN
jgi:YfiR/HmsC-like